MRAEALDDPPSYRWKADQPRIVREFKSHEPGLAIPILP